MNILFIGDVFDKMNECEVREWARAHIEYSSLIFQRKLIAAFEELGEKTAVISAAGIGAYPKKSGRFYFDGFENNPCGVTCVPFCNLWGYRNISRAYHLKRAVAEYLKTLTGEPLFVVAYSAHTPVIEAALYAKKLYPDTKTMLIVPDLPQYMNLETDRGRVYDLFKAVDNKRIARLLKRIDSFTVLTEPMRDALGVGARPCLTVEGLIDDIPDKRDTKRETGNKCIVYTGKMYERFGVKALVDAFCSIEGDMLSLVLCGDGDAVPYIKEKCKADARIDYRGIVAPEEARKIMREADVLVNPRMNGEDYTKYSFPSKNIEYLLSANAVVACMLSGMPEIYSEFLYEFRDETELAETIKNALCAEDVDEKYKKFCIYACENLTADAVARKMLDLTER